MPPQRRLKTGVNALMRVSRGARRHGGVKAKVLVEHSLLIDQSSCAQSTFL
jgi:hypothetical protein